MWKGVLDKEKTNKKPHKKQNTLGLYGRTSWAPRPDKTNARARARAHTHTHTHTHTLHTHIATHAHKADVHTIHGEGVPEGRGQKLSSGFAFRTCRNDA